LESLRKKAEEEKAYPDAEGETADGDVKPGCSVIALVDVPDWPLKKDAVGVVIGVNGDNYEVKFDDVSGFMSRTDFQVLQEFEE